MGGWMGELQHEVIQYNTMYCSVPVQCCFTSIETVQTIGDRELRTATLTLTQLLSSHKVPFSVLLYVHRNRKAY